MRIAVFAPTHALRLGLKALIEETAGFTEHSTRLEVVFEAATLDGLDNYLSSVDVLLIAGETGSYSALRQIATSGQSGVALLMLTDDPQAAQKLHRLQLRAWGVISPDSSAAELNSAIQAVYEGLVVGTPELLSPAFSRQLIAEEGTDDLAQPLTDRENQVLQLLARGLANKQIAAVLGISEHTVKFHVSSIYTKLGVTSRTEAVRTGVQQGLVIL